uniref:Uncharacterized protein n=1 Tax=Anopheles farauti TaxID=69004 RepID=A0A182QNI6_9DIPT
MTAPTAPALPALYEDWVVDVFVVALGLLELQMPGPDRFVVALVQLVLEAAGDALAQEEGERLAPSRGGDERHPLVRQPVPDRFDQLRARLVEEQTVGGQDEVVATDDLIVQANLFRTSDLRTFSTDSSLPSVTCTNAGWPYLARTSPARQVIPPPSSSTAVPSNWASRDSTYGRMGREGTVLPKATPANVCCAPNDATVPEHQIELSESSTVAAALAAAAAATTAAASAATNEPKPIPTERPYGGAYY